MHGELVTAVYCCFKLIQLWLQIFLSEKKKSRGRCKDPGRSKTQSPPVLSSEGNSNNLAFNLWECAVAKGTEGAPGGGVISGAPRSWTGGGDKNILAQIELSVWRHGSYCIFINHARNLFGQTLPISPKNGNFLLVLVSLKWPMDARGHPSGLHIIYIFLPLAGALNCHRWNACRRWWCIL